MSDPADRDASQALLNETLQRLTTGIAQQFTEDDLETPRVCALACALAMQLFLSVAEVTDAEREEFFAEVIPDMENGWHFSPEAVKASPEDNLLVVQIKPSHDPDGTLKRMATPSKLVN
jgi:hypothetical protein